MSRIIVIGGIESTFTNAQCLYDAGEEILMFYTRGEKSPGWEGVDMINVSKYPFSTKVPTTIVDNNINDHISTIRSLKPDFIWSLGWQQIFSRELLGVCPVIGIHESLLPKGAGPVPIANSILHDLEKTGITLFQVDEGMDTGPIIDQIEGKSDPRVSTSTQIYQEAMHLGKILINRCLPELRSGSIQKTPQNMKLRTVYSKISWEEWPLEKVRRARTYPYA
jgi:methionyl-tRNA formyltransferase